MQFLAGGRLMSSPAKIYNVLRKWLDDEKCEIAIKKTINEGLFRDEDVRFAIDHIRESVKQEHLERWRKRAVKQAGRIAAAEGMDLQQHIGYGDLTPGNAGYSVRKRNSRLAVKNILCLHAGNLPLVGLQDVIAVLMSGNMYFGKISRKDPWLLPSFLAVCREFNIPEIGDYSTDVGHFRDLKAHAVLFAGSVKTVPVVRAELDKLGAVHSGTKYLIRTAQLSVAYLERSGPAGDLLEAVTRYGGRGCRSVGIVVSPVSLTDYFRCMPNERKKDIKVVSGRALHALRLNTGGLKYLGAYAAAVGITYLQTEETLFLESEDTGLVRPGLVLWIRGDKSRLQEVRTQLGGRLQAIYTETPNGIHHGETGMEPLKMAQRPEIDWKPDGEDTLVWILG